MINDGKCSKNFVVYSHLVISNVHMMKNKATILLLGFFLLSCFNSLEAKTIKIACVGNSITQGAAIKNMQRDAYPAVLGQMLGEAYEVRNYGYSGRTLLMSGDRPWMKETKFQEALAFCPDIVTIKLGTNDTKPFNWVYQDEFPKDLETLVRAFQALPSNPQVIICYPVPAYRLDWGINDSIIFNGVIPYIDQVAAKTGAKILDLYTPFSGKPELFADMIHPNEAGAYQLAEIFYKYLTGNDVPADFKPSPYPGVKTQWKGYDMYKFPFKEREARIVVPKEAAPGNPWIWRPAFFGAFAQVDEALLAKGYHVVYLDCTHDFAKPQALKDGDALYKYLTKYHSFAKKATIEGFSRGGMYAINWAANYPHKTACVYVDAPVCDVFSWPGKDRGYATEWQQFLDAWGLNNETASSFNQQAINYVDTLIAKNIPLILVAGKKDKIVPYKENALLLKKKYEASDVDFEAIIKKRCDHHPHSLDDPTPIVEFIMKHQ